MLDSALITCVSRDLQQYADSFRHCMEDESWLHNWQIQHRKGGYTLSKAGRRGVPQVAQPLHVRAQLLFHPDEWLFYFEPPLEHFDKLYGEVRPSGRGPECSLHASTPLVEAWNIPYMGPHHWLRPGIWGGFKALGGGFKALGGGFKALGGAGGPEGGAGAAARHQRDREWDRAVSGVYPHHDGGGGRASLCRRTRTRDAGGRAQRLDGGGRHAGGAPCGRCSELVGKLYLPMSRKTAHEFTCSPY
eukprot:1194521-Prorocentrum_minimum.AAC.3